VLIAVDSAGGHKGDAGVASDATAKKKSQTFPKILGPFFFEGQNTNNRIVCKNPGKVMA
jgi:hypothetical protein